MILAEHRRDGDIAESYEHDSCNADLCSIYVQFCLSGVLQAAIVPTFASSLSQQDLLSSTMSSRCR
jgi:hypothetical protein